MRESRDYPVLSQESLRIARCRALHLYEAVLDMEIEPDSYYRMFGHHNESVYGFLRTFPIIVAAADSRFGIFGFSIRENGNLVLKVIERGPKTAELEEILGQIQ